MFEAKGIPKKLFLVQQLQMPAQLKLHKRILNLIENMCLDNTSSRKIFGSLYLC